MQAATAPRELDSRNPATGAQVGSVPVTPPEAVQGVVDSVARVQPFWAQLSLRDRGRYLERAAQVVIDEGRSDSRPAGGRAGQAAQRGVLDGGAADDRRAALDLARRRRVLADEKIRMPQLFLKTKRSAFTYEPLGVIGIISPWNYPWSIPFGEVALALMAGNGVVLKPASLTPVIGQRIQRVFERAGVPQGLVRVVHGPGTGAALAESNVGKVFFTGSVETGRSSRGGVCARVEGLGARARGQGPDARARGRQPRARDRGRALGRVCQRRPDVLGDRAGVRAAPGGRAVHRGGRGGRPRSASGTRWSWDTEIGPMVSREQFETVRELVDDAVAAGAELRCGGPVPAPAGVDQARSTRPPC